GLDSSAITAFAAASFRDDGAGPLHTWSVDYRDNEKYFQAHEFQPDPDAPFAVQMSEFLSTIHHNVLIDTPQLVESLTTATMARDLPGMADVDSSLYLFCKAIKQEATVVLSGECADEVFGGYPWFHQEEALGAGTFPWVRMLPERARLLKPGLTGSIGAEEYVAQRYRETIDEVPRLPGEDPLEARRREMFYLNLTWFMATLLDRKDRMSMAASLEARVPFCDHRIVEYVWNIPWGMKSHGGREKGILREALRGVLPEEVRERRKSPYPKTHNPVYYRAVRDWVLQLLADPRARLHEIVDAEAVRALAKQEQTATGLPWFGQLMGGAQYFAYLGQVETWLRRYKVRLV
ncbi:MAG: asparagine synthetase B family protein, partial [Bacillota bacterium]